MWVTAEPLIRIILGDQWSESAVLLRWLVVAGMPNLFVAPLSPLAMSLNKTSVFFKLSALEFVFKLPLMVMASLHYGIPGVLVVRVATGFFVTGCSMLAVRSLIREPIWAQSLGPWRPMLSCLIMAITVYALEGRFVTVQDHAHLVVGLAGIAGIGAVVYTSSMFLLWRLAGSPDGFESNVAGLLVSYTRRFRGHYQ
jgi:PST family polysaccharide transporter